MLDFWYVATTAIRPPPGAKSSKNSGMRERERVVTKTKGCILLRGPLLASVAFHPKAALFVGIVPPVSTNSRGFSS
jgi:hypothetical protein